MANGAQTPHSIKNLGGIARQAGQTGAPVEGAQPLFIPYDKPGQVTGGDAADGYTVRRITAGGDLGTTYEHCRAWPPGQTFAVGEYVWIHFPAPDVFPLVRGGAGSGGEGDGYLLTDNIVYFSS